MAAATSPPYPSGQEESSRNHLRDDKLRAAVQSDYDYDESAFEVEPEPEDEWEGRAVNVLGEFFERNTGKVFYFRQIELAHEDSFFHWVTNRALHKIMGGTLRMEEDKLSSGAPIGLIWHKSLRYYRREKKKLIKLVDEYSDPAVGAHLGLNGELIVLEGFARKQFLVVGRHTNSYNEKAWPESKHNLDFIFEKDGIAYGMEVKNRMRRLRRVKVYKGRFAPGEKSPRMSKRPDRVEFALTDGQMRHYCADGKIKDVMWKAGDVKWSSEQRTNKKMWELANAGFALSSLNNDRQSLTDEEHLRLADMLYLRAVNAMPQTIMADYQVYRLCHGARAGRVAGVLPTQ
jgi:hypothetical protein